MAQSGYAPISLYHSTTASAVPTNTNLVAGELALNIVDGKLYYKDNSNVVQLLASGGTSAIGGVNTNIQFNNSGVLGGSNNFTWNGTTVAITGSLTASADSSFNSTGALLISRGTTGQQPGSPVEGMLRYNTTTKQFEGYSEVSTIPGWYSVGGSAISNDTATSTNVYPLFVDQTTGTAQIVYTSNAKYLYKPSVGELTAQQMVANNGFFVNPNTLSTSYTLVANSNASTTGPFTIPSGLSVTVSSNSRWVVL
jgi:hypothetical protein